MNKASGGDGIPVELFQILKDDAVKLLHSICQQIWKTHQWLQDWKKSVFIPTERKACQRMFQLLHNCTHLIHYKVMLSIFPARLQKHVNCEFSDVQAGFRKGRGIRDQLPTSIGSLKKQENSRKTSTFALLTMPKPLTVWITTNYGKFLKRWKYQTTWPASWETYMQARKQQFELDREQRLVPNRKKSTSRLYIVTLLI